MENKERIQKHAGKNRLSRLINHVHLKPEKVKKTDNLSHPCQPSLESQQVGSDSFPVVSPSALSSNIVSGDDGHYKYKKRALPKTNVSKGYVGINPIAHANSEKKEEADDSCLRGAPGRNRNQPSGFYDNDPDSEFLNLPNPESMVFDENIVFDFAKNDRLTELQNLCRVKNKRQGTTINFIPAIPVSPTSKKFEIPKIPSSNPNTLSRNEMDPSIEGTEENNNERMTAEENQTQ